MKVERINICAGDHVDWPEPATNFRGRFRDWPVFFDNFLRKHQITDILLFGDCRPYHVSARAALPLCAAFAPMSSKKGIFGRIG